MDQVIVFDKSYSERFQEYKDVLGGYEVLPVSALSKEWGFHLDLTMEPNGWQAIWKIQRKTCEELDIPFPSIVLVLVLKLYFEDLTALVKILAVQEDIHLPSKHIVPLIHLWPTKEQDKSTVLNIQATANGLDMLRFFYNNLVMPWDFEEDDTTDWISKHLESRLRMYYDMRNGTIPHPTAEHLRGLITEAKKLQSAKEAIEADLEDLEECGEEACANNRKIQALMELHIRLMEIKGSVDILENPFLRDAVIKKQKKWSCNDDDTAQNIWLVCSHATAADYIQFLTQIQKEFPSETLKFVSNLLSVLECANPKDIFILSPATYEIKTTGSLEHGGTLKGVAAKESTVLTSEIENVMLDFSGESVVIENVTIQATSPQCAIIVRSGKLTLNNCKLVGDGKSSTHQGIIVLNGAKLEIRDCDIASFSTAIVGNSGSMISIENSEIHDCNFGLKLFDNASVAATKATIRNCRDYGISLETENNFAEDGPRIGAFETLNIMPKLQMEFITGDNNIKGDAVINQKAKLGPIADLFNTENSSFDDGDSDEAMETNLDSTVIEVQQNGRVSPATV